MKNFFIIAMIICASLMFLMSLIILIRKGKPFKYRPNITDEEKEKERKTIFIMFIFILIQSISIFVLAAGIYFEMWYLSLVGLILAIPVIIWAIKTLTKKKSKPID